MKINTLIIFNSMVILYMETFKLEYNGDDNDKHFEKLEFIPQPPFRGLLIGPSGSGKSYFCLSTFLLNPNLYFKNNKTYWQGGIYIFSPIALGEPLFKNLKHESIAEQVFITNKLSVEKLNDILNNTKNKKPKLIILDDFAPFLKGKFEKIINDIFFRCRHVNCSILILSQNYKSVPKPVRLNSSDIFVWNFSNKKELKLIEEELGNKSLNGEDFINALEEATREKFGVFYKNKSGKFFKSGFIEIE